MERLRGLLFGAIIGDAYALPAHWQYDTDILNHSFKTYTPYIPVSNHPYHKDKTPGSLTHYGDQSLLLLRSIASQNGFELDVYKAHWCHMMSHYEGYMDKASKESLDLLKSKNLRGSSSQDLGGFTICAPLITYHFDDEDLFTRLDQVLKMTHDNPELIDASHFITFVLLELIVGNTYDEAFKVALKKCPQGRVWYEMAMKYRHEDTSESIKSLGQHCGFKSALPAALLIVLQYGHDFEKAMYANLLAGGDNAARGMLIGMLIGAHIGFNKLPEHLAKGLESHDLLILFTKHQRV